MSKTIAKAYDAIISVILLSGSDDYCNGSSFELSDMTESTGLHAKHVEGALGRLVEEDIVTVVTVRGKALYKYNLRASC